MQVLSMPKLPIRELRKRLDNFHDVELDSFCQENYYEVYNNFSRGMRKDEKITHLIDHIIRTNGIETLIIQLEESFRMVDRNVGELLEKSPVNFSFIRLQLQMTDLDRMRIRGVDVPEGGAPIYETALPFSAKQLKAVLKAIEIGKFIPSRFRPEYAQTLRDLGLLTGTHLHSDLYKIIGCRLYDSIFRDEILASLRIAQQKGKVVCQLVFDPVDIVLSQFPWELIHDGNMFMVPIKSGMELVRCINSPAPVKELKLNYPLKVLYLAPRPDDDDYLPQGSEKQSIESGMMTLSQNDLAGIKELSSPTYSALEEELSSGIFHILHFDGHSSYSRCCPNCQLEHYPSEATCQQCGESLVEEKAYGYIHFENEMGLLDKIKVDDFKVLVANSGIQLIVLTSCNSSVSKEVSIFNGIGPGLLQAGIPSVIAMQGSPTVDAMNIFVKRLYTELSQGKRITEAVNSGRLSIYHNKPTTWFVPTVFLRTSKNNSMALPTNFQ